MRMQVEHGLVALFAAVARVLAACIFALARSVFDFVYQMVLQEERERAENAALVHGLQPAFEGREREGLAVGLVEGLEYQ